MPEQSASLQEHVADLNESISEFVDFAHQNGHTEDFPPIHFVGTPDAHSGESALIDHWDEFLQYSRAVLNEDSVPRDDALGQIDGINLEYKRTLSAIQNLA